MNDGTDSPSSSGAPRTEKKRRPIYACLPCHKRRVKASTLIAPPPSCSLLEEAEGYLVTSFEETELTRLLVQCDHLKPCTPCCLRGTPSQCEFTEEGSSAHMLQSDLIKSLTEECAYLESRLAELESLQQHSPEKGYIPAEESDSSHSLAYMARRAGVSGYLALEMALYDEAGGYSLKDTNGVPVAVAADSLCPELDNCFAEADAIYASKVFVDLEKLPVSE
ncbi:hypothetical protein ABOM_007124 [Aspergillus bombycis]|uniref:Uncharacterized protein n=1 Tax=Aspergillus bombycis TaxID=109264 RepID=A0A1F8A0U4_9EURO|nr:hypothetical protein ABOM_007124 [Aspergillus bombycis]OGM44965.1 hypothetical protein ABOM_007124 [Aspergillus bombycis]